MENTLRFWGVRGSLPTPGPATAGVGGNTSCVEVRLGGERIIIDGGSGLRALGSAEPGQPIVGTMLFSHMHWDHIQGVPFYGGLYHPMSQLSIIGPEGLEETLEVQMSEPTFPVGMDAFGAKVSFAVARPGDRFTVGGVEVRAIGLNHPGGALGFCLTARGASLAYLCDHEQGDEPPAEALVEAVRGVDVLICDAQYTPEEYELKRGWGHSTYAQIAEIALAAEVGTLYLTHHDPMRSDIEVSKLEKRARRIVPSATAAREGGVVLIGAEDVSLPHGEALPAARSSSSPPA